MSKWVEVLYKSSSNTKPFVKYRAANGTEQATILKKKVLYCKRYCFVINADCPYSFRLVKNPYL